MKPDTLRRYDLNLLVILHVLLDECSVSRAAERLHLSQSAISRALSRLRDLFGDDLFLRRPHGLQATTRAIELQSELSDALSIVTRLVAPPVFCPTECTKTFTISAMEHLSLQLMPPLLARLREEAPKVKVQVNTWSKESLSDMMTGKLDMSVNILPLDRPDFHRELIVQVKAQVLVSKNHPLAGLEQLSRAQYLAYPHVSLTIAEYAEKPFASQISMLLANRDVILSTSDPHLAFEVVSQTQAMMIGTTVLSHKLLDRHQLKAIALPEEMSSLYSHYQLTWHRLMNADPAHAWFRKLLFEECQSLLSTEVAERGAA